MCREPAGRSGVFTRQTGDDSLQGLWCVHFKGAMIFFDHAQISEDVESRVENMSAKITLCNTILKDLKELNDILVVSQFSFTH